MRESPEKALPLWTVVFFCAECGALPPFSRSTNLFDAGLFLAGPGEAGEQWNGCNTSRPPGLAKGTVNLTLSFKVTLSRTSHRFFGDFPVLFPLRYFTTFSDARRSAARRSLFSSMAAFHFSTTSRFIAI